MSRIPESTFRKYVKLANMFKHGTRKSLTYLKENRVLITIVVFSLILFSWYEILPSITRATCSKEASKLASGRDEGADFLKNQSIYDIAYQSAYEECLHGHGLQK